MTVDYISVPLGIAAVVTAIFRLASRKRYVTVHPTVLALSLGSALLLRSPWFGDVVLDHLFYALSGIRNVPDVLGHLIIFVAICAVLGYVAYAVEYPFSLWPAYVLLGCMSSICVLVFLSSSAVGVDTTNIVLLSDMTAYGVLFSVAMFIAHFAIVIVLSYALRNGTLPRTSSAMLVGAVSGLLMVVHRVLVVAAPSLENVAYGPITWSLSLVCIGGYTAAVVGMSWSLRSC